jgi:minor extracellular serine protease Vpr
MKGKLLPIITVTAITLLIIPYTSDSRYIKVMLLSDLSLDAILSSLNRNGVDVKIVDELKYVSDSKTAVIAYMSDGRIDNSDYRVVEDRHLRIIAYDYDVIGLKSTLDMKDSYGRELDGDGIKIAIIDTGIDYTHRDLRGFGIDGKVVGGYDFLEKDTDPLDEDGHGTAVAGIIAANGNMKGIAPKAKLLAYKIASNGNYTSSLDIIRALDMAARDGAKIVNISIGMDTVSYEIDNAVNNLVRKGILVVAAAGNNGQNGMGSPATAKDAITVGTLATNVSTMITTLRVGDYKFEGMPMLGSAITEGTIKGELVFVNYARERDVSSMDLTGKIAIAERGGERIVMNGIESMERVYFSEKERNVASKGAIALIVYNNEPGIFYGTLIHEDNDSEYEARIPVIALSRDDGLKLRDLIAKGVIDAELRSENSNGVVATFSSRGPASPFYIKPNLVAPGVGISSTTLNNSYSTNNGTSFAAPYVSGAAALLMQRYPDLTAQEIASLLVTTAKQVKDVYGDIYSFDAAGAGLLALDNALNADIVAMPHNLTFHLNGYGSSSKSISIRSLNGDLEEPKVTIEWLGSDTQDIVMNSEFRRIDSSRGVISINLSTYKPSGGERYEAFLRLAHNDTILHIPTTVYINTIPINAVSNGNTLYISLGSSDIVWKSAVVKVIDSYSMRSRVLTLTPDNNSASTEVNSGEYWIDATVNTDNSRLRLYTTVNVNSYVTVDEHRLPVIEMFTAIGSISAAMLVILIIGKIREERSMKNILERMQQMEQQVVEKHSADESHDTNNSNGYTNNANDHINVKDGDHNYLGDDKDKDKDITDASMNKDDRLSDDERYNSNDSDSDDNNNNNNKL